MAELTIYLVGAHIRQTKDSFVATKREGKIWDCTTKIIDEPDPIEFETHIEAFRWINKNQDMILDKANPAHIPIDSIVIVKYKHSDDNIENDVINIVANFKVMSTESGQKIYELWHEEEE